MSWSVGAKGTTPEVGETIEKQFESANKCPEPEEGTRQSARKLIAEVVKAQTDRTKLNINAYGSQSVSEEHGTTVSLGIKIDVEY